jgi:hypothetical protein
MSYRAAFHGTTLVHTTSVDDMNPASKETGSLNNPISNLGIAEHAIKCFRILGMCKLPWKE